MIEKVIRSVRRGTPPSQKQEVEEAIAHLREAQRILGGDIQVESNRRPRFFSEHEEEFLLESGYVLTNHTGRSIQSMFGGLSDRSRQVLGYEYTAITPNRSIAFHPGYIEVVPEDFINHDEKPLYFMENRLFADDRVKRGQGIGVAFLGTPRDYLETALRVNTPDSWEVFSGRVLSTKGILTFGLDKETGAQTWLLGTDFSTPAKLIPLVQPKSS